MDRTEGGRCAPEGTRTPNLLNRNQMLYPLSYGRLPFGWVQAYTLFAAMQNQALWPEPHRRNASCSRSRSSSIYKDPPRTRQRTLILAAFLPWGGSDDTVTRRTGPQHTRFCPARAAARGTAHHHGTAHLEVAAARIGSVAAWPGIETTRHHTQHHRRHWYGGHRRAWPRCRWAAAGPGRASRRRAERSSRRGRLAGGPPPTGTPSSPAAQHVRRPEHQRHHKHHRTEKPQNSS